MSDRHWTLDRAIDEAGALLESTRANINTPASDSLIDAVETLRQVCKRLVELADEGDSLL